MATDVTLIFPSCLPHGELYAEAARERGERVVAASSLRFDPTARKFDTWFYLPSVHEEDFQQRLNEAIAEYDIARVYCPVLTAYDVLNRLIEEGKLSIKVIGDIPLCRSAFEHREIMKSAAALHALIQDTTECRSDLSPLEIAAVLRQSLGIFGESDQYKIAAMMAIFADAPAGDVIEIGVLAGRSACVLALMAQRYGTGAVLAIDTWSSARAVQRDSNENFQRMVEAWLPTLPIESFFESFLVSLLPIVTPGSFNYLMQPSTAAHGTWFQTGRVETSHFGLTDYRRYIAVLHIDANHDYAQVRQDCELWLPHLVPGGWLILDDYVWMHGHGPRRVGDALLTERASEVQRAFVCGKALFVKLVA
jgi:hypothetical protein